MQKRNNYHDIMTTANDIIEAMLAQRNEEQRRILLRFFKTGRGEYGEGDKFLGLKVPQTRAVVKEARRGVPLGEIEKLISSEWHEVRLCGFLLLVEEMKAALPRKRQTVTAAILEEEIGRARRRRELAGFYLRHAGRANNWDLVDLSCGNIVGEWLAHPAEDGAMPSRTILDTLAHDTCLWKQRIAIVSTITLIRRRQYDDTLRIATTLLHHPHDLIHKAVGWMLREVGKRDISVLRSFLAEHCHDMPRTALRYAIEKMDREERAQWMK